MSLIKLFIFKNLDKNFKIICFVLILIAPIIRFFEIEQKKFWIDEKWSIIEANGLHGFEFDKVFTRKQVKEHNTVKNVIKTNVHYDSGNGIIYFVSLHYWLKIFGRSIIATRVLSLIFGILIIVFIGLLAHILFQNKFITILSLLFSAIHPQLIHFSQEARPYNLAILMTLISSYLFFKIYFNRNLKSYFIFYSITASFALLSHYSTSYILIAHIIIAIIDFKFFKNNWKMILFSLLVIAFILSIWMFNFGLEGIEIMSKKSAAYIKKSIMNPTSPHYKKTTIFSIIQGWLQNLISMSGCSLVTIGLPIRYNVLILSPLFVFLFFLKSITTYSIHLKCLIFLTLSSLIYASVLSIISNNILPFQTLYSSFSTPYFIITISFFLNLLFQNYRNFNWIFFTYLLIVICSSIVLFVYRDKEKNIALLQAKKILEITQKTRIDEYKIIHANKEKSMEINLFLDDKLTNTTQLVSKTLLDKDNSLAILFYKTDSLIQIRLKD